MDKPKKLIPDDDFNEWERLIARVREWDRREHDWAMRDKSLEHKNRKPKSSLVKDFMREYDLKKKTGVINKP